MNWGNKILLVFAGFAIMIGTLVYKCTQQKYDLVSADYYDQELKYQDKIDGMKAAARLTKVTIIQDTDAVRIKMPAEQKNKMVTGEVWMYCAANAANDVKLPLHTNDEGEVILSKLRLAAANYTAKVNWQAGDSKFYDEIPVTVLK